MTLMMMTMKLVDPVVTRRAGLLSHDMHLTVFYQNHDDDDDASNDNYDDDEKHFVFRKLENHHTFFSGTCFFISAFTTTIHMERKKYHCSLIMQQPIPR